MHVSSGTAPGSDAKRLAIIAAATAAFTRDGFAQARIGDIADAAAVGKGTVYEYFASKEELLLACCLARCAQDREDIGRALAKRLPALGALVHETTLPAAAPALPDPLAALRELLITALTHLLTHSSRDCRLFMELFTLAGERDEVKSRVKPAIHAMIAQWEAMLGALVQAGIAAGQLRPHPHIPDLCRVFSSMVDGLLMQRAWRDDLDPETLARRVTDAFLATLLVEPTR